ICIPGVAAAALSAVVFAKMRRSSLEVLLCGLSLFDVLVLLSTLLIYPAMNACQNEPNPFAVQIARILRNCTRRLWADNAFIPTA
ncbi:hypothetical protein TELCIR_18636, partial [Teladorsagia circumcincta]